MKILIGFGIGVATVLIVLSILAIVGGTHPGCWKCFQAKLDIHTINSAIEAYARDNRDFPPVKNGIALIVENDYLKVVPDDPWGNEYNYTVFSTEEHKCFMVWTFGSDSKPGGNSEPENDVFVTSQNQCLTRR